MKATFLHKQNKANLILFFNGWGMDENVVKHIACDEFDLLMINEYDDQPFAIDLLLAHKKVYLLAWSLGVWVANKWLHDTKFICEKVIAINGTLCPIDVQLGIAPNVFEGTVENWSSASRSRFELRMFKERSLYLKHKDAMPNRTVDNQKTELQSLQKNILAKNIPLQTWHKTFVGKNDCIFVAQNQLAFWQGKAESVVSDMPHFPFCETVNWNQFL